LDTPLYDALLLVKTSVCTANTVPLTNG